MGRIDWFFEHEANFFETRLHRLVVEIYRLAKEQLDLVYEKELDESKLDPTLSEDPDAQYGYENYLRGERLSQERALATMALAMLGSLVDSFLDEARLRLDATTFPIEGTYPGKSILLKRVSEYKERFGIDLVGMEGFEGVREVVLARNSCIHNGGHPSTDYMEQTNQRLLEEVDLLMRFFHPTLGAEDRVINFSFQSLKEIVSEISKFADSLHKSLNAVRLEKISRPPLSNGSSN
jgi:hypothetical protein